MKKGPRRALAIAKNLREAIRRRNELDCVVVHRRSLTDLPASVCLPLLCGHAKGKLACPPGLDIVLIHDHAGATILEKSLRYAGIDRYTVLRPELNRPWYHTVKLKVLDQYIRSSDCTAEFILYIDSDDAVIREDPSRALELLEEERCDLLFSNTRWPSGYECMPEIQKWADALAEEAGAGDRGSYLNSGVYVGRKDFLASVLERALPFITDHDLTRSQFRRHRLSGTLCEALDEFPKGVGSDQIIYRYLHPHFHPGMKIDYFRRLALRS